MNNIAIFASGQGTNAENIIAYFNNHPHINVQLLASNRSDAYALVRAKKHGIPAIIFNKDEFYNDKTILDTLVLHKVDTIVLAGFLWLIPGYLIDAYPRHIINIHPALLPEYGGKGMYGMNVHHAVIDNKERETGITIHTIDKEYDKGEIIFQKKCAVEPEDTLEIVAEKVHALEYKYFPPVIEDWLTRQTQTDSTDI
ncbi:MAG: phosphoribosylglycinamide formyltransferase [Prevotellaceae bacterium]|jgi:phosphoribosylglycinamide formyltransferase-1|nr:phosphoribosylglycinamide formyltransferase [Prevotellaceae bacterium]